MADVIRTIALLLMITTSFCFTGGFAYEMWRSGFWQGAIGMGVVVVAGVLLVISAFLD